MLSSQIAVSLVNALLYEKLESRVQERTRELQDKDKELKEAFRTIRTVQEQVLQKEKIASLGLMTAGIAQEINFPLEHVNNLSREIQEELGQLLELSSVERKERVTKIKESLKTIESEGYKADEIIKDLLNYAHQGSQEIQKVDPVEMLQQAHDHVARLFKTKDPLLELLPQINMVN